MAGAMYMLTFPSGKSYIGITSKLDRRMILHRSHARTGRSCALHRAIRKYGERSFVIRVLVVADDWDYLRGLEQRAIDVFKTTSPQGYNLTLGGEGRQNPFWSLEARARMSAIKKGQGKGIASRPSGWKHTEEARAKIAAAGMGRVFSEESRAKIGVSKVGNKYNLGRQFSDFSKSKSSASQKGRKLAPEHILKLKGKRRTPEFIQRMSDTRKGKPWSATRRAAHEARKGLHVHDTLA